MTSTPSIWTEPTVGSISLLIVRMAVDLPEPDKPITTKSSPSWILKVTSFSPKTWPVCIRMSSLEPPFLSSSIGGPLGVAPKIFVTP